LIQELPIELEPINISEIDCRKSFKKLLRGLEAVWQVLVWAVSACLSIVKQVIVDLPPVSGIYRGPLLDTFGADIGDVDGQIE
jgi:hypothetical protein